MRFKRVGRHELMEGRMNARRVAWGDEGIDGGMGGGMDGSFTLGTAPSWPSAVGLVLPMNLEAG